MDSTQLHHELEVAARTAAAEYAQEQKLIAEGRTLVAHNPKHNPVQQGAGPAAAGTAAGWARRRLAEAEADAMQLKPGALRRLFLRERQEGWIGTGQYENVTEQGLLDFLVTPLTLGLVHGPGAGTTTLGADPKTGRGKITTTSGPGEKAEAATNWLGGVVALIKAYGPRLLEIVAGGILVLFGLATLAKGGQAPNLPKVIPV